MPTPEGYTTEELLEILACGLDPESIAYAEIASRLKESDLYRSLGH